MKKKIIDYILIVILLLITIALNYLIYTATLIPQTYRIVAMAVFDLIALLFIALSFKQFKQVGSWIRRIFIVLLCAGMCLSGFYVYQASNFTKELTKEETVKTIPIDVVTLQTSDIEDIEDLENKIVGYQNETDITNAQYVIDELANDVANIQYADQNNYITLAQQLLNEEIDALIISSSFISSFEEVVPDFESSIKIIDTFQKEEENEIIDNGSSELDLTSEPYTILVNGTDSKVDTSQDGLSDVVMLLMVNPTARTIDMVSFPRDSYLPNPALGYVNDKLTHTGNNGIQNVMETIEIATDIEIDFYIKVNFSSVLEVVNVLGGIDVDVQYAFSEQNSERSFAANDLITLQPGLQTLDGEEALAYARHRKTEGVGDIGRTKAQQQIISGVLDKVLSAEGALKVPALLDTIPNYSSTNITEHQLNALISHELEHLQPWTINNITLENGYFDMLPTASMGSTPLSVVLLDQSDLKKVYDRWYLMENPTSFKDFSFNVSDLEIESDFSGSDDIYYSGDDTSGLSQELPESEEEIPSEEETLTTYVVNFYTREGNLLLSQEVEEGSAATAPFPPELEGYTFIGWDKAFDAVYGNINVFAEYVVAEPPTTPETPDPDTTLPETPDPDPTVPETPDPDPTVPDTGTTTP